MQKKKEKDSLKAAAGKSLKKLSKKQQYEMFGIREKDHKMKDALAYVLYYNHHLSLVSKNIFDISTSEFVF